MKPYCDFLEKIRNVVRICSAEHISAIVTLLDPPHMHKGTLYFSGTRMSWTETTCTHGYFGPKCSSTPLFGIGARNNAHYKGEILEDGLLGAYFLKNFENDISRLKKVLKIL